MTSNSKFGPQTEAEDVAAAFADSVRGKTILITGVSPNGLGATIAHALATQSPTLLILTGRDSNKVNTIIKELAISFPNVKTRALIFDLSSFESVNTAAAEVQAYSEPCIDIIINNAGVMDIPTRTLSKDGMEMHLAINYLGPWLFTNSIMGKLLASKAPRITNITSDGFAVSPFRFVDYNFEEEKSKDLPEDQQPSKSKCEAFELPWVLDYLPGIAYGQSKTALILYTHELAASLKHMNVVATCCNPGTIKTDLWRNVPPEELENICNTCPMKTHSQGAATPLVAALDPKLVENNGAHLNDCRIEDVLPWANNAEKAQALWALSEKLTGKRFNCSVPH